MALYALLWQPLALGSASASGIFKKCNNAFASSESKTEYKGITIIDFNWGGKSRGDVFFQIALDALQLIERYDTRRFRRVLREIKYVVNEVVVGNGEYDRIAKRCSIDFGPFLVAPNLPEYEWHTAQFASFLIYEATHGSLFSRFVSYIKPNRKRVEYICYQEQKRFAARLPTTQFNFSRDLVPAFDEQFWDEPSNSSPFKRIRIYADKTLANYRNKEDH